MSTSSIQPARAVALETTLLVHGVPREAAQALHARIGDAIRASKADPALIGVIAGRPIVGMSDADLAAMLALNPPPIKLNTANLGVAFSNRLNGATTVSATVEIAAHAGIAFMATGGLGGVHRDYATHLDISADLLALARFPVAVVASGVKSLLDVAATREALESLGVPVVGYRTDHFPAFYQRTGVSGAGQPIGIDARFEDARALARFARHEIARTGRGLIIVNPVPAEHEIPQDIWEGWLAQAQSAVPGKAAGRDVTPAILARVHELSAGLTLRSNIELVVSNAALAGQLAATQP